MDARWNLGQSIAVTFDRLSPNTGSEKLTVVAFGSPNSCLTDCRSYKARRDLAEWVGVKLDDLPSRTSDGD